MAYEQKDNSGSLFKNDRKETDSHPNAKGTAMIGGVEYWVDAWTNTAKSGDKYQSLKFKRKDADQTGSYARQQPASRFDDVDEDTPF